jgi:RecA/RadA recombinase
MRSVWKLGLALLCATTLLVADADSKAALKDTAQKLITESRTTREMAMQIAEQLRKSADTGAIRDQIATLEQHAASIRQLIVDLESKGSDLTAKQRQQLETARKVAEILNVFIENKKQMLASVTSPRDRDQVRYQAIGVAQRAEMIEKTISRLGL